MEDDQMMHYKYFKRDDAPSAYGLSKDQFEEYQIQQQHNETSQDLNMEELKTQDRRMEGNYLQKMRENERREREQLLAIYEQIPWQKPRDHAHVNKEVSYKGQEKENHSCRISEKLSCYYARTQDIPTDPLPNCVLKPFASEKEAKIIPLTNLNDMDFNQILSAAMDKQNCKKVDDDKFESQLSELTTLKQPVKGILKLSKEEKAQKEREALEIKRKQEEEERQMKQAMSANSIKKLMDYLSSRNESNKEDPIPEDIKVIFKAISKSGNQDEIQRKIELIKKIQNDKFEQDKKKNRKAQILPPKPQVEEEKPIVLEKPVESKLRQLPRINEDQDLGPKIPPSMSSVLSDSQQQQILMQQLTQNNLQNSSQNSGLNNAKQPFQLQQNTNQKYETKLSQDEKVTIRAQGAQFKTLPCKFYHGRAASCTHDEICTFIHDELYQGLPHPKFSLESQLQAFTKEQQDRFIKLNKKGVFPPPPLTNKEIKQIQEEFKEAQGILQQKHTKKQAVQQIQMQNMMETIANNQQMFSQLLNMQTSLGMQGNNGVGNNNNNNNFGGGMGLMDQMKTMANMNTMQMDPQQMMMNMAMGMGLPQGYQPPPPGQQQKQDNKNMNFNQNAMQMMMQQMSTMGQMGGFQFPSQGFPGQGGNNNFFGGMNNQ